MSEEKMEKRFECRFRGLRDPGTALIVVYVSIVLFLLLFAGLESAMAERGRAEEKTLGNVHRGELLILGADKEQVRKTVLATALEHHLVSDYPSLVAVEQQIAQPSQKDAAAVHLKTNLPQGWRYGKVFGGATKTATASELLMILGVILLLAALILAKER